MHMSSDVWILLTNTLRVVLGLHARMSHLCFLSRADCPERCEGLDGQCVGCGVRKGGICRDAKALIKGQRE